MKWMMFILALALTSCRKDPPPAIELCKLRNGVGACDLKDGTQRKRPPSEMNGYAAMPIPDLENYAKWCYNPASPPAAMSADE